MTRFVFILLGGLLASAWAEDNDGQTTEYRVYSDYGDYSVHPFWELRALALAGDVNAQYELATRFAEGIGVQRDADQAHRWFSEAAARGRGQEPGRARLALGDTPPNQPRAPEVVATEPRPADSDDPLIAAVQRALDRQGYWPGPIDGRLGPQTRAAIRYYQRDHGLWNDGLPTPALVRHLEAQAAPLRITEREPAAKRQILAAKALERRSAQPMATGMFQAHTVKLIQQSLKLLGYAVDSVDGQWGPLTQAAIRRYQRDHRMGVDGQVSAALMEHLSETLSKGGSAGT